MKKVLLLSGLAYGLFIVGLASLEGGLIALAIPLVLYLASALLHGPEKPHLTISRTVTPHCISQGGSASVEVVIKNEGAPLEEVLVEDFIPPPLVLAEGEAQCMATLPTGAKLSLSYTVQAKRGRFDFQAVQVTASDYFGLFRQRKRLAAPGNLLVLPEVPKLQNVAIRPLQTRGYAGPIPSRQGGAGVNFFGVREYQMGDPLRWINWRASARHVRTMFSNEFEQERIADVGLILDARRQSNLDSSHNALFEHAIQATAALAEVFLSDGNRVGLLIYGRALERTFPGYGKIQRERILHALAQAQIGDSMVFESLDYLPTRFFPARSQIVLISPLIQDDMQTLNRLRARGYEILIISPDPITFEAATIAPHPEVTLAKRIARLERALLLRKLKRIGIRVVDWQVDIPLDHAIYTSLGRRVERVRTSGRLVWA